MLTRGVVIARILASHAVAALGRKMTVAIAVPVYKAGLEPDEVISLRHLRAHLGERETFAVCPEGLELPVDLPAKRFDRAYFGSVRTYSDLLMSPAFYDAFRGYDHILLHQLDCLVLGDRLDAWCEDGWDYVGAPWVRRDTDGRPYFAGVGNGGLSLRRTETFLRVLELADRPGSRARLAAAHALRAMRRALVRLPDPRAAARALLDARFRYEDKFWSEQAVRLVPGFRIPAAEEAVAFAFETEPRFCFEQNGGRLPFGCHRWAFHDRDFWTPYLLPAPP